MDTNHVGSAVRTIIPATAAVIEASAAAGRRTARHRSAFAACALAASLGLLLVSVPLTQAFATPTLSLSLSETGFATQTVSGPTGTTVFGPATYGGYTLTVFGNGDITGNAPYLSLTLQVSHVPTSLHPLTVQFTETGIPGGPGTVVDLSTANTAIFFGHGSTIASSSYYDLTDTAFGTQHQIHSTALSAAGYSSLFEMIFDANSIFSVTKTFVLTPGSTASHPQGQGTVNMVLPEPSPLSMFGPAAAVLGLVRLRRRRTAGKPAGVFA